MTRGGERVAYDTADVAWSDGDLFVATGLLDRLLGVRTSVEWEDLSAMVGRIGGPPGRAALPPRAPPPAALPAAAAARRCSTSRCASASWTAR